MYTIELYNKTVDILFQAYFNDMLKHKNCAACAVGNIIAAKCEFEYFSPGKWRSKSIIIDTKWQEVFCTVSDYDGLEIHQIFEEYSYIGEARLQIDSTGYNLRDLSKIEYAFESAPRGNNDEDWMFNGLVAVLDLLKDIHGIANDTANKKRFSDHYKKLSPVQV